MKPLKLKMKAFGSYANETIVNFDELDSGLYLVTGDTGAGKTTIFDAMVFALYGEASGTGRNPSMLHSDFAPKSEDTVVELEFEHIGRIYKVERKLHCAKKRDGSYDEPKQQAVLYEEDKLPIEIPSKVTARIIEIIGLDANQFKQIIVLAQGEFQKFLKADGRERNEILGKLFDNSPYVKFETRLKKASDQIEKLMTEDRKAIDILMDNFKIPAEADETLYIPANPNLIANIEKLIEEEKEEDSILKSKVEEILKTKSEYEVKKSTIESANKALDLLSELNKKAEILSSQKEYYDQQKTRLDKVEKASKVVPFENKSNESLKRYSENDNLLSTKNKEMLDIKLELDKANSEFEKVKDLNDEKIKLNREKDKLQQILDSFKPYNEAKLKFDSKNKHLESLMNDHSELEKEKEELSITLSTSKAKKEEAILEAEKLSVRELEYETATKMYEKLNGGDGLIQKLNEQKKLDKQLSINKKDELELINNVKYAKTHYDELYDSFIRSQSSILAKELKETLENSEEALCPVCHSHLVKSDISKLAFSDEIITQDDVEASRKNFDKLEATRQQLHTKISNLTIQIENYRNICLDNARQLDDSIKSFDEISDDYISRLTLSLKSDRDNKSALVDIAKKAKQTSNTLTIQIKDLEEKISNNEKNTLVKSKEITSAKEELSAIKATVDNLYESLKGLSESETKTKLIDIEKELVLIEKNVESLTNAKNALDTKYNTLNGTVATLKKNNELYLKEYNDSNSIFNAKLAEYGFIDTDVYHSILGSVDGSLDLWLNKTRDSINNYQIDVRLNTEQLNKQKELCKDLKYGDLTEIENSINNINQEYNAANTLKENNNAILKGHEDILKEVKKRHQSIAKFIPAGNRLKKLSDLANGYSTDGGKLSFDRYVMGDAFAQILDAANVHLAIMTGGQYELIHQTKAASKASIAGLDIDIMDSFTGEQRKPDSLSGGEKFQVSMALALGLSDVVQDHAGGKKIESMYIDEGFGTLDEVILDKAIEVLKNIAGDTRQIGIISHVARLEESIPQKIIVRKTDHGSVLTIQK